MTTIPATRVAEVFVQVADTLVDDFDLIEFLELLTTHIAELTSASAVGLLLGDHHRQLHVMAATTEAVEHLEMFQIQAAEGPCPDCFATGDAVVNTDLNTAADRWPRFAPRAVELGFESVHAFPLRLRRDVIGALGIFGNHPGDLSAAEASVVQALADVATIGILQERAVRRGEVLTEQLQSALNTRVIIEQAKGVLAQIHGETPDQAFRRLRGWSRANGRLLASVAEAVIAAPASVEGLVTPD